MDIPLKTNTHQVNIIIRIEQAKAFFTGKETHYAGN
jgi:hypothetical protein